MNRHIVFLLVAAASVTLATVNAPSALTGKGGFTSPTTTKGDLILRNSTIDTRLGVGADGLVLTADSAEATGVKWGSVAGTGDVVGPASATDNAVCRFDGVTGKAVQDTSQVTISDTGIINSTQLTASRVLTTDGSKNLASSSVTTTTLDFLDATSSVQTQLNAKAALAGASFTGAVTVATTSGPQVIVKDSGTFGVDADPYVSFQDGVGQGGYAGFTNAASNDMIVRNLVSGGKLSLQTNAATIMNLVDSTTGNQANYSTFAPTLKMKGTLFAGASSSDYPYIGHNARSTVTGNNWEYDGADKAALLYFTNGGFKLKGTATTGAAGGTITFTDLLTCTSAGVCAIPGSVTVTGNITNSALTASRVMVSDGSKNLASSTMTQTLLESMTVEQIDGMVEAPSNKTYIIRLNAKYAGTINEATFKTASGTITAAVQIEGVSATGCSAISVTSTESTTSCTAANTVSAGHTITIVTTSNSSGADLQFSIKFTRS